MMGIARRVLSLTAVVAAASQLQSDLTIAALQSNLTITQLQTDAAKKTSGDWPMYRHDTDNSGSASATAALARVGLRKRWTYVADSRVTSTPTIASGVVYAGTSNGDVIALDAQRGRLRWRAHLGANSDEAYGYPRGVIGSVAIADGVAYASSANCFAAAFNALDGSRLWRSKICDNARNDDVYASPVVAQGLVLIGIDILEDRPTDRGRELALDAKNGKLRWLLEPAKYRGMGTGISATAAIDAATGTAFLGTGNPTPMNNPPAGDDPGSDSILAIDIATGRIRWSFGPVHRHDLNDDDFFASPNRLNIGSAKKPHRVIGEGNKDGAYYVLDARTGRLLWRRVIDQASTSAMIIGTAAVGHGVIFVPLFRGDSGSLTALRASDGVILWQSRTGGEYEAPVLWGSVVFTTEASGWLDEFQAGTGKLLGRWQLCGPATGRGPSLSGNALYVASGKCLTQMQSG